MKKSIFTAVSLILLLALLFNFAGCATVKTSTSENSPAETSSPENSSAGTSVPENSPSETDSSENSPSSTEDYIIKAVDLLADIQKQTVNAKAPDTDFVMSQTEFAVNLLKNSMESGKNNLVSPLSVMIALAMTANGASGETKAQMESVLGGMPIEQLNEYLVGYISNLPSSEDARFSVANSIWYKDVYGAAVRQSFLQTGANYYRPAFYKAPFNDETLEDINNWIRKNTDGMIKKALDEISDSAVMYLINALAFDAKWSEVYHLEDVRQGTFHAASGKDQKVEMMHSHEGWYLTDGQATGFKKAYKGGKYSFAALLPEEGMSVEEYVATLTGEKLQSILGNAESRMVDALLPKFSYDCNYELKDVLTAMGMSRAFDGELADFSEMFDLDLLGENVYIGRVIHKTHISVNELGTRAGAVTMVEPVPGSSGDDIKMVHLDRPFVYMIVDNATNLPVFIGVLESIS